MKSQLKAKGFTIVELLTVMGIVVVLISLLLPALSMVRDFSNEIQQKAQFHSIEVGIGMYEHDFGTLPPSQDNYDIQRGVGLTGPTGTELGQADKYCGAMKLAEAMVGMDMLGFHPKSGFFASGTNTFRYTDASTGNIVTDDELDIYTAEPTLEQSNWQTAEENLEARKGPYIDLENANVSSVEDVYGSLNDFDDTAYLEASSTPLVLCDVFSKRRQGGEKTGSPVLYFKARTQFSRQDRTDDQNLTDDYEQDEDDIYNVIDNYSLLELGVAGETGVDHPVISQSADGYGIDEFERMIVNDKVTTIKRPYRASSYILWSAGKDGLFGTADDIFNFDRIKE